MQQYIISGYSHQIHLNLSVFRYPSIIISTNKMWYIMVLLACLVATQSAHLSHQSQDMTPQLSHNQVQIAVELGIAAAQIIVDVTNKVKADKSFRSKFTQQTVNRLSRKYPGYNVIMVHTKHHIVSGQKIHKHIETPKESFGQTTGFEIYLMKKGQKTVFVLDGDGGYLNWAMQGNFKRSGKGNKTVTFT